MEMVGVVDRLPHLVVLGTEWSPVSFRKKVGIWGTWQKETEALGMIEKGFQLGK